MPTSATFQYPSGPKATAPAGTAQADLLPTQQFSKADADAVADRLTLLGTAVAALQAAPAAPAVVGVTSSAVQFTLPAGVTLDQLEVSITPAS